MKTYYVDFDGWLKIKANSKEEAEADGKKSVRPQEQATTLVL